MKGKDILSINDLLQEEILAILTRAKAMKENSALPCLQGSLMASCFYEPSTRTRLSFESAMKRLKGDVIGFAEGGNTSIQKGESLHDSMKVIGSYADVIVIRHPLDGSARQAAEAADVPVINAGDGTNEHPTQTLLDLFSIQECQNKLDDLNIVFVGDLLYGRTVHSLAMALKYFKPRLYFVSPLSLAMPNSVCEELRGYGIRFSFHRSMEEVIERADILYMTRIQRERFPSLEEYHREKDHFVLNSKLLEKGKSNLKIFHPLPRINEISTEVDNTKHAYYFTQAKNGVYVRQALLSMVLGA